MGKLQSNNQRQNQRDGGSHHERLSAVEVDVHHLDQRLVSLANELRDGFSSMRRLIEGQRQPITAFAGWASVILALVYAFGSPLAQADSRHQARIDMLLQRELDDAETRGRYDQRFTTLEAQIEAAVINRKDIDAKHVAATEKLQSDLESLSLRVQRHQQDGHPLHVEKQVQAVKEQIDRQQRRLEELAHVLDNGLGRRIDEKLGPIVERMIALERNTFETQPNERDMDRK